MIEHIRFVMAILLRIPGTFNSSQIAWFISVVGDRTSEPHFSCLSASLLLSWTPTSRSV